MKEHLVIAVGDKEVVVRKIWKLVASIYKTHINQYRISHAKGSPITTQSLDMWYVEKAFLLGKK